MRQETVDRESEAEETVRTKRNRKRIALVVLAIVGVATLGTAAHRHNARIDAVDLALAPIYAPYAARGFELVLATGFMQRDHVEASVQDPTCFVAVSPEGQLLTVDRGEISMKGGPTIAWCTCGAEKVRVSRDGTSGGGGVALLRMDASKVGGNLALPFLEPRPATIADAEECSTDQLDAWIVAHEATMTVDRAAVLADPRAAKLSAYGMSLVAGSKAPALFAITESRATSCSIAFAGDKSSKLSLRLPGDKRPLVAPEGPIAWCSSKATKVTVWREGGGAILVFEGPADRVGGTLGLREVTGGPPFDGGTAWVAREDLEFDATMLLRSEGLATPEISAMHDAEARARARLVSLSIESGSFTADAKDPTTFACAPPLSPDARATLCAETGAFGWRPIGGVGTAGIVVAPLPFWMQTYSAVPDSEALKAELTLLTLARRLHALGLEPTVLDGVSELADGVDVLGRAGSTEVVAVGMLPEWPWAFTYTDGPSWDLEGEPRRVSLAPRAHVKLMALPHPPGLRETRRTVVFRNTH